MTYLAPLNSEIMERKVVTQRPILPGTRSEGTKTERQEPRVSMMEGM